MDFYKNIFIIMFKKTLILIDLYDIIPMKPSEFEISIQSKVMIK